MKNNNNLFSILFLTISVVLVLVCTTQPIITSPKGAVSLTSFESFFAYIIAIVISIYMIVNNKKATGILIFSLFTYIWTYFLVYQMIEYITDLTLSIEPIFYLYLSSALFLLFSLFFHINKKTNELSNNDSPILNNLDKNNFLFTNFVLGTANIPYDTTLLLVNNTIDNTLDLIYNINNNNQVIKLDKNSIKNIYYKTNITMQNVSKITPLHETKSILLSAVVFGGNPIAQYIGSDVFNDLFDDITNNYDKVNFNTDYEIIIETIINNEEIKFILNTKNNPEKIIKLILNK